MVLPEGDATVWELEIGHLVRGKVYYTVKGSKSTLRIYIGDHASLQCAETCT